jgi:hypothetical protein
MSDDQTENLRPCTQQELEAWQAGSIRGIKSSFSGNRADSKGNIFREFTVDGNDEFATTSEKQQWEYINWHQKNHKVQPVANCKICVSEQQFKQQHADLRGKRVASPPCKQCGYGADAHVGPTRECPV